MWVCLECFHEWNPAELAQENEGEASTKTVIDSNGNVLSNGDSVVVIKDLKVKGYVLGIKVGTKVKNITLVDGHDGHNISCKIDGFGSMSIKSEFVKKV
jgi:protein PhnA